MRFFILNRIMEKSEKVQWKNQLVNFVAVVVGVYAAFYLTNWKSNRDERDLEKSYLMSMSLDLKSDIEQLQQSTDTLRYYRSMLATLTRDIYSGRIPGPDSLMTMINGLYLYVPFIPGNSTYQSMLESGNLDVIEDFELRKYITELYHIHYGAIEVVDRLNNEQRANLINPYMFDHFVFGRHGLTNADKLWKEPAFGNLVTSCYYSLNLKLMYDSIALQESKDLKIQIDRQ